MKTFFFLVFYLHITLAWWPFSEDSDNDDDTTNEKTPQNNGVLVPFEIASAEQKFLQEAKQLLDLSPLDQCQHKVIHALRKSCSEMSEEELAKMSVQLLNCQSEAEGRKVFPCTSDMTVAECTGPMDAHMWNAYHIISNRARSVCYATRQQQFRHQTEVAVNQLSHSTLQQIKAMEVLASNHEQIRRFTNESLEEVKREQEDLLQRQTKLSTSQEALEESIHENIDHLTVERSLIQRSQQQLKNMTDNIRQQLEIAREMLASQDKNRQESQQRMKEELDQLSENVRKVWKRIDNSTNDLLILLNEISGQYEDTISNLKTINNTVAHVLSLLDTMNSAVSVQLGWVMEKVGGAQDGLRTLTTTASHFLFLLISCLILLFLKAPWLSRLALLILVLGNLLTELKFLYSFSLVQLAGILLTILLGDWGKQWYGHFKQTNTARPLSLSTKPRTISPVPTLTTNNSQEVSDDELDDLYKDITSNGGYIPKFPPPSTPIPTSTLTPHKDHTPNSTSSSFLGNQKCAAMTRNGLPCRLNANVNSPYCHRHGRNNF